MDFSISGFDQYKDKIDIIKAICLKYDIDNENLYSVDFLKTAIPTGEVCKATLFAAWKRPANSKTELGRFSTQQARPVKDLEGRGYIWRKGNSGTQSIFTGPDGNKYREVIGWEEPTVSIPPTYVKVSSKERRAFLKDKRDPYTAVKEGLEFDHRTPTSASIDIFDESPAVLTSEMLHTGEVHDLFQPLTRSMNARKREVCKKCMNGATIMDAIPVYLKESGRKYKNYFDDLCHLTRSCVGCYFYNPAITQDEAIIALFTNKGYTINRGI